MNHVLIVEDEKTLSLALSAKFTKIGIQTLLASNGKTGLELATQYRPDVILLDLVMPDMDGFNMLTKLRATEWGKEALVIILTNLTPDDTIKQKLDPLKPAAYYVKSMMPLKALAETITTILGHTYSDPEE